MDSVHIGEKDAKKHKNNLINNLKKKSIKKILNLNFKLHNILYSITMINTQDKQHLKNIKMLLCKLLKPSN